MKIIDLQELGSPCILPIKLMGYRHFTVFKGIYQGHIFLADPFKGHTSYTLSEFEDMWYENVIFVVYPEGAQTKKGLALKEEDLRFVDEDSTYDIHTFHERFSGPIPFLGVSIFDGLKCERAHVKYGGQPKNACRHMGDNSCRTAKSGGNAGPPTEKKTIGYRINNASSWNQYHNQ